MPSRLRALTLPSALLFASLGVACDDPASDAPAATVEPAAPAAATNATTAQPSQSRRTLLFDQSASRIEFVGSKVTASHEGRFGVFAGRVEFDPANPAASSVQLEIDASSISVPDSERLTGHLKSDDFFDVARFPKARFASTAIRAGGANGATHTITGTLDLHGVQRSVTFPATVHVNGDRVHLTSEFSINRRDFGLVYPGMPDDLIRDDVLVRLNIDARPPSGG